MARAISYREDAILLLDHHSKPDSAAALIYESAKQCINAVANLNGQNPGAVGAKRAYLRSLTRQYPGNQFNLIHGWEFATRLHIHADRSHLAGDLFRDAWQVTQAFIDDMLTIYDTHV